MSSLPAACSFHKFRCLCLATILGLFLALFLPTGLAQAAPVAPNEIQITQPDGTVIKALPYGDESSNGYEYQGRTILRDPASGYWVYAAADRFGGLTLGTEKAGIDAPPAGQPQHLRSSQAGLAPQAAAAPLAPQAWGGSQGTQKVLIILVDFTPTSSLSTSDAAWNQAFFNTTPGAKSVRNFYEEASFANFHLVPADESYNTVNDGVIAVTLNYAHPNPPAGNDNSLITRNALIAADPYINYASLDTDGNGALDVREVHLMIIVRGYEQSYGGASYACTPNVWGHRGGLVVGGTVAPPVLDGITVASSTYGGGYTQEGEWHQTNSTADYPGCDGTLPGHMATIGIMVHELGHDINWPDLYDTDNTSEGIGSWSIMSSGSWGRASGSEYQGVTPVLPDAFLKWYQGWLTPIQVTAPLSSQAIPNSAQNASAYLLGVNPSGISWTFRGSSGTREYFLIENRQLNGFDTGLWSIDSAGNAKGCLIYHIDETRITTNTANADETHRLVDVEEANGVQNMDTAGNRGDAGDPWPGNTANTTFNGASTPNSNWYDGTASGIAVTNITTATTGCTLDFSAVGPAWTGSAGSSWNTAGNWSVNRAPTQNDNLLIPGGAGNWPAIDATALAGNLNILSGAHLTADANVTFSVSGNWNEADGGYFQASAGTVVFQGSGAQTITIGGNSSYFNNLQIGSSTTQTVTAASDLDVNGSLTIQAGARLAAGSHNLSVAGGWTDVPYGFLPGTGKVTLDGTSQTVQRSGSEGMVYSNDISSLSGWVTYDANGNGLDGGSYWTFTSGTSAPNSPDSGQHARYVYSADKAADDWLFSPGFTLQAGIPYTIRFNYGARSAAYPEKLAVYTGNAQGVGAMQTQVFDNSNVINETWAQGSGTFTPGSSGTYYVGFHAYSAADNYELAVDTLSITASQPDLAFYDLTAAAGSIILGDNTAVQRNLQIDAGATLTLGSSALTVEGTLTNSGALAQTQTANAASTSFLNIKNSAGNADKYFGVTLDPGAGNLGSTTVTIWGNQLCPTSTNSVLRCFELDPTNSLPAAVTFYYTEAERGGRNNATLQVYHWNSTSWDLLPGTTTRGGSGDSQWVRVTGISAYSPFALNPNEPTAVTAFGFEGQASGSHSILLDWRTAFELDLLGFHLYRAESLGGTPLQLNASLIPTQSPEGGSYSFEDQTVLPGGTYYYWLEMVRIDRTPLRLAPVRVSVPPPGGFKTFVTIVR